MKQIIPESNKYCLHFNQVLSYMSDEIHGPRRKYYNLTLILLPVHSSHWKLKFQIECTALWDSILCSVLCFILDILTNIVSHTYRLMYIPRTFAYCAQHCIETSIECSAAIKKTDTVLQNKELFNAIYSQRRKKNTLAYN